MKKLMLMIVVLIASRSFSQEKWFCTDDQAMRQGNTLSICGVATFTTEGQARQRALDNAIYEFQAMCNLSSDCKGHKINIEPKRSTCFENQKPYHSSFENFTCHRMFVFTIL